MIAPNSRIILLKVPISIDNKNQLTFENATKQFEYFYNLPKQELEEATYQRKDNVIRYPWAFDNALRYNYVMYQNTSYSDKWFYAFITNLQYVNDNMTLISIETDCFQTWQFNIQYRKSFVEREMINVSEDVPRF